MSQTGTSKISVGQLHRYSLPNRWVSAVLGAGLIDTDYLLELQLVGKLQEANKLANPDHFAALYIPVPKARHKIAMPARGWSPFHFNISLAVGIIIYRRRRLHKDAIDAQDIAQGHDFVGRDTKYELTEEMGSQIDLRLYQQRIWVLGLQTLQIFQQTVPVIDEIADAITSQVDHDAAICDPARSLQDMLRVANIVPDLARIPGTDDAIADCSSPSPLKQNRSRV
ncbi:hypothetical protein FIBSPDRAFT_945592 [Athelia psychrophila]|uniref:Uncharacterized protein n=1 Tax=Athelia psychrophila TaxID=1759441 RepID=A0A166TIR7_9AGAM|nr:hypothetical protein FIBSPDRAFT_945592 [Fibularhizoctonia sp. CBS 109695]